MAFTFNWAGVSGIQHITPKDRDQQIRSDAAAYGAALKGFERYRADKEYAQLLDEFNKQEGSNPSEELATLMAELQRLKQRNAEIQAQLGG